MIDYQVFSARHSFSSSDQQVLQQHFPHISFYDIPDAWLILIDEMLQKMDSSNISRVSQCFGFLVVEGKIKHNDFSHIELYEKKIREIDYDLFDSSSVACLN